MEYIKKEELIIGEIYKSNKYNHIFKYQSINGNTNINISCNYKHFSRCCATIGQGLNNITNATSEEKHWLNTCIEQDKFITFEEATKTFIPEYVEAVSSKHSSSEIIGTIYKTSELPRWVQGHKLEEYWKTYMFHYKPSTKEAYDAQFKTKEIAKVKPFEILETCRKNPNRIKQVINEEGNIFMIDDIITPTIVDSPNKGKGFKIIGFRLNKAKNMICAITDSHSNGIGIDKIEHFIEKDEFVLPKLWHIRITSENYKILSTYFSNKHPRNILYTKGVMGIYKENRFGHTQGPIKGSDYDFGIEITFEQFKKYVLKEEYEPKVGDKFRFKQQHRGNFIIDKIQDSTDGKIIFYNQHAKYNKNHNRVLLKNITIIK